MFSVSSWGFMQIFCLPVFSVFTVLAEQAAAVWDRG